MTASRVLWLCAGVLWCCLCCGASAAVDQTDEKNSTRGVDEFLTSLTQMIGTVLNADARYAAASPLVDGVADNGLSVPRPNRPSEYFETGRPPFPNRLADYGQNGQRPSNPPPDFGQNGQRPYPPPDFEQNGQRPYPPPGFLQGRPPGFLQGRPPGFLQGRPPYALGGYPQQNSIMQALSSISRHDDLRCVPRLLCEVSSGTRTTSGGYRPGYYQQQQQQSTIPFLTKDALITLLTVLNFVDDSPLLMFGRAALLGINSRDDPRSCITAYPTCPRDPNQLIDYLNNHNGGFFRFFNQQIPQFAPQYAGPNGGPSQYPPQPNYPGNYPGNHPGNYPGNYPSNYAPNYAPNYASVNANGPQQHFGYKARADWDENKKIPRILSGTASQYYDVPSVHDLPLDAAAARPPMVFPDDDQHGANSLTPASAPFAFPSDHRDRQAKRVKMTFPDRTGTGGLRADVDQYGNYKGVYYADGAIKFLDEGDGGRPTKIRLPSSVVDFDIGNRLPYGQRRPNKLKFPKTA